MDHPSNRIETDELLEALFTYHRPTEGQQIRYVELREAAKDFARVVLKSCPGCADRTAAIRHIREAVLVANAAIACEPAE